MVCCHTPENLALEGWREENQSHCELQRGFKVMVGYIRCCLKLFKILFLYWNKKNLGNLQLKCVPIWG